MEAAFDLSGSGKEKASLEDFADPAGDAFVRFPGADGLSVLGG